MIELQVTKIPCNSIYGICDFPDPSTYQPNIPFLIVLGFICFSAGLVGYVLLCVYDDYKQGKIDALTYPEIIDED